MTNHIVIAKYRENTRWAEEFPLVTVIEKGIHLPNKGREPTSYLWYIINRWDELKGHYVFTQGNPTDHLDPREFHKPFEHFKWYRHEGWTNLRCDMNGRPHDDLDIKKFLELIGLPYSGEVLTFNARCIVGVSAERIKSRPKSFYERCYDVIMNQEPGDKYEYVFERVVGLIWAGEF